MEKNPRSSCRYLDNGEEFGCCDSCVGSRRESTGWPGAPAGVVAGTSPLWRAAVGSGPPRHRPIIFVSNPPHAHHAQRSSSCLFLVPKTYLLLPYDHPPSPFPFHSQIMKFSSIMFASSLLTKSSALAFNLPRHAARRAYGGSSSLMFAKEGQAEVILVGCGAPNRGMGWYHAVQMLEDK